MARKENQYFKLINNATPPPPPPRKQTPGSEWREETDETVGEKGRERERTNRKPRGNKEQHRVRKRRIERNERER